MDISYYWKNKKGRTELIFSKGELKWILQI